MYAAFEEGNTLTYKDLQTYLDKKFPSRKLKLDEFFIPRVKDLILDACLSNKRTMNPCGKTNVFELLGFDFLIDEDFRTWLIEVNTNPYLGTPNEAMQLLVPQMVNDVLKIVVDPVMPPTTVPMNLGSNGFELLYQDASARHGNAVN